MHVPIQVGSRHPAVLDIELDGLSPRAAAIARIWSANRLHSPCPLILESEKTLGEMVTPDEAAVWGPAALSSRHRFVLDIGGKLPGGGRGFDHDPDGQPVDPVERARRFREQLERIARQLPIGYIPVGGGEDRDGVGGALDHDELHADADLITRDQVVTLLRELGRPVSPAAISNYRRKPPAGWPQPVKYVGRTPLWSRTAIETYAAGRESA